MIFRSNFPFSTPSFGPLNDPRIFHGHSLYLQTSHSPFHSILRRIIPLVLQFCEENQILGGQISHKKPFRSPMNES